MTGLFLLYGNFDLILNRFLRVAKLYVTHTSRCDILYESLDLFDADLVLIAACCLLLGIMLDPML